MSQAALLALVLGGSLTAYALLAGADFGAGILDLLAGACADERAAIARTIGPVWEANHVWLIFSITILFSAFPVAFSALGTALLAPLTAALLAIVVRGAALGLRSSQDPRARTRTVLSGLFGVASVVAPFAFGLIAGGLAQAAASPRAGGGSIPWTGPVALVAGLLALCLCTALAAGLMTIRMARAGESGLAERFRRRGLQAGAGLTLLAAAGLLVARLSAPALLARLTHAAWPVVVAGLAAMAVSLLALASRRYALARIAGLVAGAGLVWGWLIAQSPHLVGAGLTIRAAAATPPALTAVAIACGAVLLGVIPALLLLFTLFATPTPTPEVGP